MTITTATAGSMIEKYGSDLAMNADGNRMENRGGSSKRYSTAESITRANWNHFLNLYAPLEKEMLQKAMQTDFTTEGNVAGQQARTQLSSAAGSYERNLSRSGLKLSPEERVALNRRRELSGSRAQAGAENTVRRTLSDQRQNMLTQLTGIGRGVANATDSSMQSLANTAANREMANRQMKDQRTMAALSTAATMAVM